jgi:hypothetical protein
MEIFTSHHHTPHQQQQNQHSLSQDSTSEGSLMMIGQGPPPPTLSRLPPDGHEFPPDYRDPASSSSNSNTFQNSEMLSRKSSASSTGSLDRSTSANQNNVEKVQNKQQRPLMKHDEHSASSVKAKIAMFSNAKQSRLRDRAAENSSVTTLSESNSKSLTRSLTHGDVRFEEVQPLTNNNKSNSINPKANHLGYRSMVNMNKEFNQSTDSLVRTTHARLSRLNSDNSKFGGRSQSLMEIGAGLPKRTMSSERKTPSPHSRSQSSSGIETPELPDQRRKNTLTKMKGLVIPEVNNEAMASPPPPTSNTSSGSTGNGNSTNKLSPPPWKSTSEVPSKYSPAYKRKPFTEYRTSPSSNNSTSVVKTEKSSSRLVPASTGTGNKNNNNNHSTVTLNHSNTSSTAVKSDDSDNDSAVSSGRSSLSHSSVSPPASPKSAKNNLNPRNLATSEEETIQESPIRLNSSIRSESTSSAEIVTDPRILKKDSVEAINRRNILESCKKSSAKPDFKSVSGWNSGRPASRSSSFTIAERKKSFEMHQNSTHRTLGESKINNTHSSQDSLSSSRKASREYDSAFTSRRPSKEVSEEFNPNSRRSSRGSATESIVDTIKDIENRVAYMSDIGKSSMP